MCAGPSLAHLGPDELIIKLKKWREAKPRSLPDDDQSINDHACNARCNDLKIRTLERYRCLPYPGVVGQFPNPAEAWLQPLLHHLPSSQPLKITMMIDIMYVERYEEK